MELVSVVVPIYNAQSYLADCLDSIIQQSYQNIEIILVNDGSNDSSLEICNDYKKQDSRVKVFSIENGGPASARKYGVKAATGSRITFVDADDLPAERLIEKLVKSVITPEIDLVTSGYVDEKTGSKRFDGVPKGIYETEEDKKVIYSRIMGNNAQKDGVLPFQWGKLFRTDIALKVYEEVDEQIWIGEDREFTRRYVLKCGVIHVTDICEYLKRYEEKSLSRSNRDFLLLNVIRNYVSLRGTFEQHPEKEVLMKSLNRWIYDLMINNMRRWGILQSVGFTNYVFPFYTKVFKKRVALYGAGEVGQSYFYQLKKWGGCSLALWVDKKYETYQHLNEDIRAVTELDTIEVDYVIVAVVAEAVAEEIKSELISGGINESIILWERPISVAVVIN